MAILRNITNDNCSEDSLLFLSLLPHLVECLRLLLARQNFLIGQVEWTWIKISSILPDSRSDFSEHHAVCNGELNDTIPGRDLDMWPIFAFEAQGCLSAANEDLD